MCAFTVPAAISALSVSPSATFTENVPIVIGVVIAGSSAMFGGIVGFPELATLPMITATAPAFCAFRVFSLKPQPPRSTNTILPA